MDKPERIMAWHGPHAGSWSTTRCPETYTKNTFTTHVAAQIESARAEGIRHGRREMRDAILALIDTPTYKEGV